MLTGPQIQKLQSRLVVTRLGSLGAGEFFYSGFMPNHATPAPGKIGAILTDYVTKPDSGPSKLSRHFTLALCLCTLLTLRTSFHAKDTDKSATPTEIL